MTDKMADINYKGVEKELLKQESMIQTHVLKHTGEVNENFSQKQLEFKQTCYAIKTIIKKVL